MFVAGVDEVGQGAIAGPLVVCAAVFEVDLKERPLHLLTRCPIEGVKDSKKFSSRKRREEVSELILDSPALLAKSFGVVPSSDINRRGMSWAWKAAALRAVEWLTVVPELVILDGDNPIPGWGGRQISLPKADTLFWPVSAASVLAKVRRDRWMVKLGKVFPGYAWEQNMGYGTTDHASGVLKNGVTPLHRTKYVNSWFRAR